MHVLVACEASGTVCKAFRDMGHLAWSVDTQATYGPLPQFHIQDDVLKHLATAPDGKNGICVLHSHLAHTLLWLATNGHIIQRTSIWSLWPGAPTQGSPTGPNTGKQQLNL